MFGLERSVEDTGHMMTRIMDIVHGGTTICIDIQIGPISDRYNQMFPLDLTDSDNYRSMMVVYRYG